MIDRACYSDKIIPFINRPFVKVFTGVRSSGKSSMLLLMQEFIKKLRVREEQIIAINFESMAHYELWDAKALYTYVVERVRNIEGTVYLFFDEIQVVERWEEAITSFLIDFPSDIYITGSNSQLLASELSTLLTGRYIHVPMQPLSFQEMAMFRSKIADMKPEELLWLYIRRGGFPAIHIAPYDEHSTYAIINNIYDSIVLRDVVDRYKIRNIDVLQRVMRFIIGTIGSTISAKRIADYFKSQYRAVDVSTIYTYLEALTSSYIISKVQRYDIRGRELLKTQEKYYLADPGIQHAVFGYRDRHISGVLENIVYNELVQRGYTVYVGKIGTLEVDFVAEKTDARIYVQVAYKVESEKTLEREFKPLLAIRDSYPKYVVSMDSHFRDTIEGVRHISLLQFLSDSHLY